MAEVNLICLNCGHGPHGADWTKTKRCAYGLCPCETFIRPDVHSARALTNINNAVMNIMSTINGIADLLCMVYPEAYDELMKQRAAKEQQNESTSTTPADNHPEDIPGNIHTPEPAIPGNVLDFGEPDPPSKN